MRRQLTTLIVALLIPLVGVQSATADESKGKNSAVVWGQLTPSGIQRWLLNSQIRVYECLAKPTRATLSLQSSDGLVEAARTVAKLDPKLCATSSAHYAAKYEFTLTVDGQKEFPGFPGTHAKLLAYQGSVVQGLAAVYEGSDEMSEDQIDGKLPSGSDESDQSAQPVITTTPVPLKSSAPLAKPSMTPQPTVGSTARAGVGWNGCSFNGVPMFGRVKVVSVGAQFKIRFVGGKAALKVKSVNRPAKKCGEWQFVSAAPAFTVEPVQSGEDFTVSLGAGRTGVSN